MEAMKEVQNISKEEIGKISSSFFDDVDPLEAVKVPQFVLDYREEAKDHFVKITEWLKMTGLDAEWEIVLPKPNQLFLDFDTKADKWLEAVAPDRFYTAMLALQEAYGLYVGDIKESFSRSKSGNAHCIVTLPERIQFSP